MYWLLRRVHLFLVARSYLKFFLCFFPPNCFAAKNNCHTRHLAKILFHLACCLQEYMSSSGALPLVYEKAFNAVYISSIFLKHLIESVQGENIQLYLSLEDNEDVQKDVLRGMYDSHCFRFRIKIFKCKMSRFYWTLLHFLFWVGFSIRFMWRM